MLGDHASLDRLFGEGSMRISAFVLAALLSPLPAGGQDFEHDLRAQIEAYTNSRPERAFQVEVPPDAPVPIPDSARENLRFGFQKRMALSGHGVLFDIDGNRVELSDEEAFALQEELLAALREDQGIAEKLPEGAAERLAGLAREFASLAADEQDILRRAALRHLEIRARAWRLEDQVRGDYLWRADYILNAHIVRDRDLPVLVANEELLELLKVLIDRILGRTAYMGDCDRGGVPVPPDFATAGSLWTHQGNLITNMADPGGAAQVWTWAHSGRRGACVALPRGTGAGNDVAGIICQGAASGNACFWDNLDRATGDRIPWAGATLVIKELQDGTMLAQNCTGCHRGNNVYLLAPDDPTWCRLLRGGKPGVSCAAPGGASAGNLTLHVEGAVNLIHQPGTSLHHASYFPMSGTPARPTWTNTATASASCGGICHLDSVGSFTLPAMPPACGTRCY
jgi:hypothetical protein